MSDKLKELTPINITFEDGESPTSNKIESSFDQVANAMNVIERAIGDVWNQSSETGGPLDSDPNHIANIARAIGSMSSLNPNSLGGNELSVTGEAVPEGKKIFALNNAPDNPAVKAEIVFANPTGVFDTLVTTLGLVVATGDYFIEANGLVHTFSLTGSDHTASYDYTTVADSYSGATYNVMPDPAQTVRCTVIVSGDGSQITLPTVNGDGPSKNYGQQLLIPGELDSLLDNAEIPAGYIYVWDHVGGGGQRANSIIEGLTFKKIGAPGSSLATFYVEGVDLAISASEPNRYSVICAGTRVSKTLEYLRNYLMSHKHNDNLSEFLSHTDLLGSDAAVAHGVISAIVGVDDEQTLQNKTLVEPLIYDAGGPDIMIKALSGEIVFRDSGDTVYETLGLNSIPDALTGKQAQYVTDANDGTSDIPASSVATDGNLYPLSAGDKFPNAVLNTGSGNGLDADTLDGQHAPSGTIVGTSDTQTLTNKSLNSGTVITATGDQLNELVGAGTTSLHSHSTTSSNQYYDYKMTYWLGHGVANTTISSAQSFGGWAMYNNLTIESGGSITVPNDIVNHPSGKGTYGFIVILCRGTFWLKSGGSIDGSGVGSRGGYSNTQGAAYGQLGGSGGGAGRTQGGINNGSSGASSTINILDYASPDYTTSDTVSGGNRSTSGNGNPGDTFSIGTQNLFQDDPFLHFIGGAGGGGNASKASSFYWGERGGALVLIKASNIIIEGSIDVSGEDGRDASSQVGGTGAGGGGGVVLIGNSIDTAGSTIDVTGGAGGTSTPVSGDYGGGDGGEGLYKTILL